MLSHCRQYQPCPVLIVLAVGSAAEGGLANIFSNIQHATDTPDRGDQQCNALWYLDNEHLIFSKADITAKSLNLNIIYLNLLYTTFFIDIIRAEQMGRRL